MESTTSLPASILTNSLTPNDPDRVTRIGELTISLTTSRFRRRLRWRKRLEHCMEESGARLNRDRLASAFLLTRSFAGRPRPETQPQSQIRPRAGAIQEVVIRVLTAAERPLLARARSMPQPRISPEPRFLGTPSRTAGTGTLAGLTVRSNEWAAAVTGVVEQCRAGVLGARFG
jgi:hypothetical protein